MSRSAMDTVKEFYQHVNNDGSKLPEVLHEHINWDIIKGFPYGGTYTNLQSVFEDFFGRVMEHFEYWKAVPEEYIDAGDKIIVRGHYETKAKETGQDVVAVFAHIWTVSDGMITKLQQYADSAAVSKSLNHDVPAKD